MRTWTKVIGATLASLALITAGVAISAGTGSAQTPTGSTLADSRTAFPQTANRIRPAIADDTAADEAVLTPIVPCRAVDTRHGGGRLANGTTRPFLIAGSTSFSAQGGPSAGCAIPANATALAAVISAVNPSALGYFKAFPFGTPAPNSSIMDYSSVTTSSGATITITPNVVRGLSVFNFGGPTDLTLDITGYYQPQISADIAAAGGFFGRSSRVLADVHTVGSGFYAVTVDRPVEGPCSAQATPLDNGNFATAVTEAGNVVNVRIFHLVGGTVTPGDDEFNFTVTC